MRPVESGPRHYERPVPGRRVRLLQGRYAPNFKKLEHELGAYRWFPLQLV